MSSAAVASADNAFQPPYDPTNLLWGPYAELSGLGSPGGTPIDQALDSLPGNPTTLTEVNELFSLLGLQWQDGALENNIISQINLEQANPLLAESSWVSVDDNNLITAITNMVADEQTLATAIEDHASGWTVFSDELAVLSDDWFQVDPAYGALQGADVVNELVLGFSSLFPG